LNEEWGLDFMEDRLLYGRKVRAMTLEDRFSRDGLALEVDFSMPSRRVIRELDAVAAERGYPDRLRVDNGPELTSLAMLKWAADRNVELVFIEPGKPAQNAWIESFNGRVRDEFLNLHLNPLGSAAVGAFIGTERPLPAHPARIVATYTNSVTGRSGGRCIAFPPAKARPGLGA
jgi:transposase InsO family protein